MARLETVEVVHPEGKGTYSINKTDFDPEKHTLANPPRTPAPEPAPAVEEESVEEPAATPARKRGRPRKTDTEDSTE